MNPLRTKLGPSPPRGETPDGDRSTAPAFGIPIHNLSRGSMLKLF